MIAALFLSGKTKWDMLDCLIRRVFKVQQILPFTIFVIIIIIIIIISSQHLEVNCLHSEKLLVAKLVKKCLT